MAHCGGNRCREANEIVGSHLLIKRTWQINKPMENFKIKDPTNFDIFTDLSGQ